MAVVRRDGTPAIAQAGGGEPGCLYAHAAAHLATHGPSVAVTARSMLTGTDTMHHGEPTTVPMPCQTHVNCGTSNRTRLVTM